MRPFEILTFVTLLFSLIALFIKRKKPRWVVYIPGFILIAVLCQVVFEGVRWQMIPMYAFASNIPDHPAKNIHYKKGATRKALSFETYTESIRYTYCISVVDPYSYSTFISANVQNPSSHW